MKTVLIVCCLLMACGVQGQNYFSLSAASNNQPYTGFEAQLSYAFTLFNSSAQLRSYQWTRTDICPLPSGWTGLVCDCDHCYTASDYVQSNAGTTLDSCAMTFTYYFELGAAMGSHTTKLNFTDPLNAVATADIYLTVNGGCPTGTTDLASVYSLSVFPNPVNDQVRVGVSAAGVIQSLRLLDMSGRSLLEQPFPASATEWILQFPFLSTGTYLLQAIDREGRPMGQYRVQKF